MDLRAKLRESLLAGSPVTKLSVFDFDGTLIDTPLPEFGKPKWEEKTGTPWAHKGWWSKPESLDMKVFDMPTIPSVISAVKAEFAKDNTMVIMLTGRIPKLAKEVKAILDSKGLRFDAYLYNYGDETSANKREQMEKILKDHPSITEIELWDDRDLHIPVFQEWGDALVKSGRLTDFKINHVIGEHHGVTP
jgi:hypothetical protein